ncbi:nucleotidyltransferase [Rhizobium laguerreae]|uniref:nucleotidyltransferase n=1 Tax=Rhizobium laguerreae TaxID=1076926 RepID=UPI001C904DF3|nr:nucleotidyltransferase [Rhizobium laguerreae]MBY3210073.1 hypothetical protein [Rhizobium laguerreae]
MHPFYDPVENEILSFLVNNGVRFVVIGGAAAQYHGVERARDDLDILLDPSPGNAARFVGSLQHRFPTLAASVERIAQPTLQIRIGEIDVLTSAAGLETSEAIDAALPVYFEGGMVPVLSKAHLIATKRARGDAKDYSDLAALGL